MPIREELPTETLPPLKQNISREKGRGTSYTDGAHSTALVAVLPLSIPLLEVPLGTPGAGTGPGGGGTGGTPPPSPSYPLALNSLRRIYPKLYPPTVLRPMRCTYPGHQAAYAVGGGVDGSEPLLKGVCNKISLSLLPGREA